jgi:cytochrome P450
MGNAAHAPVYRRDMFSRSGIRDPYPHYAALRELGPVVWLSRQRVYALPRYTECKAVLRDDTNFISGEGVALNRLTNRLSRGTTPAIVVPLALILPVTSTSPVNLVVPISAP